MPSPPRSHRSSRRASSLPGRLRIIAGRYRGRFLPVLSRQGLRPTTDRMRVQLFSWLEPHLPGAHVLDLCAGTGILGCEALSRGAASAVFVERDPLVAAVIRENLARLEAPGEVVTLDAQRYLAGHVGPFDLVFLDPPYADHALRQALLSTLFAAETVEPGGHLVLEAPDDEGDVALMPLQWRLVRRAAYAHASLLLMARAPSEPEGDRVIMTVDETDLG